MLPPPLLRLKQIEGIERAKSPLACGEEEEAEGTAALASLRYHCALGVHVGGKGVWVEEGGDAPPLPPFAPPVQQRTLVGLAEKGGGNRKKTVGGSTTSFEFEFESGLSSRGKNA